MIGNDPLRDVLRALTAAVSATLRALFAPRRRP
jgi:hypothetical protein